MVRLMYRRRRYRRAAAVPGTRQRSVSVLQERRSRRRPPTRTWRSGRRRQRVNVFRYRFRSDDWLVVGRSDVTHHVWLGYRQTYRLRPHFHGSYIPVAADGSRIRFIYLSWFTVFVQAQYIWHETKQNDDIDRTILLFYYNVFFFFLLSTTNTFCYSHINVVSIIIKYINNNTRNVQKKFQIYFIFISVYYIIWCYYYYLY